MKYLRKLTAFVLAVAIIMSGTVVMADEKYPTKWDLTEIYANTDMWNADYNKAMQMLPQYEYFRGKLNTVQGLYDYMQFSRLGELTKIQSRLSLYAFLGYSLNPSDPVFSSLMTKLNVMSSEETKYSAFVESEIFSIPLEQRKQMFENPRLKSMKYYLRDFLDDERVPFSEETNTALAILSRTKGCAENTYNILLDVDLPSPTITMPNGEVKELTNELYSQIIYSDEYSRDFKALCNQTFLTKPVSFVNTFTALLENQALENYAYAQLEHYETAKEAALDISDVDPRVYDMIVDAARKGAADYRRYLDIHKRGLGLDVQYPFDLADYVSNWEVKAVPYEDAVEEVREALSVLGAGYLSHYDRLVNSSHMDVYPTDTKTSGAFMQQIGNEYLPYMLFNYVGYSDDVSTLAHEIGHAIYSCYSTENQNLLYCEPTTFTHEVASTTNELLYYKYKMEHAATNDEKLFYLENMLSMFSGTFFTQVMYSEFEDAVYKTVESGNSLDCEKLSDLWMELLKTYRGDTVKIYPDYRYQWTQIPHFYYNYYVYQYATSVAYAASICERITNGEQGAVNDYLSFLKLGGSKSPAELLSAAKVDPMDEQTYQQALDFYCGLVDEYEALCGNH